MRFTGLALCAAVQGIKCKRENMKNNNINKIPKRLLNECCFCHSKGLKPGILAIEFRQDFRSQEYFSSIASELSLDKSGICKECKQLVNS